MQQPDWITLQVLEYITAAFKTGTSVNLSYGEIQILLTYIEHLEETRYMYEDFCK